MSNSDDSIKRTSVARALGLGSAKSGTRHWWLQRLTALALIPLSIWFIASIVLLSGDGYAIIQQWIKHPINTAGITLLLGLSLYHGSLGMQVVYEDYIANEKMKRLAIFTTHTFFVILGIASILALLQIFLNAN